MKKKQRNPRSWQRIIDEEGVIGLLEGEDPEVELRFHRKKLKQLRR